MRKAKLAIFFGNALLLSWGKKVVIREDQNMKEQFDLMALGSRIATSVGGLLLGIGGDVVCVDDHTIYPTSSRKRSARPSRTGGVKSARSTE